MKGALTKPILCVNTRSTDENNCLPRVGYIKLILCLNRIVFESLLTLHELLNYSPALSLCAKAHMYVSAWK